MTINTGRVTWDLKPSLLKNAPTKKTKKTAEKHKSQPKWGTQSTVPNRNKCYWLKNTSEQE